MKCEAPPRPTSGTPRSCSVRPSYPLHAQPMTYRATAAASSSALPGRAAGRDRRTRARSALRARCGDHRHAGRVPRRARLARHSDWPRPFAMRAPTALARGDACCTAVRSATTSAAPATCAATRRAAERDRRSARPGADPRVARIHDRRPHLRRLRTDRRDLGWSEPANSSLHLPAGSALLLRRRPARCEPHARCATFAAHAYAFPTTTRAEWSVRQATS